AAPPPNARWDGLPGVQISEHKTVRTALHFSVRLPGKGPGELFSTQLPGSPLLTRGNAEAWEQRFQDGTSNVFRSQWAEVAWWLPPAIAGAGQQELTKPDGPAAAGFVPQPLYVLRRRQLLMWGGWGPYTSGPIDLPGALTDPLYAELSTRPSTDPALPVRV